MANKNDNQGINPATAGIVGAVVGAAVGAAAVALSDEKNRKMVQDKIEEYKQDSQKAYTDIKKTASDVKGKMQEFSSRAQKNVEEVKSDTKKKLEANSKQD